MKATFWAELGNRLAHSRVTSKVFCNYKGRTWLLEFDVFMIFMISINPKVTSRGSAIPCTVCHKPELQVMSDTMLVLHQVTNLLLLL